jgi:hypothetical protein
MGNFPSLCSILTKISMSTTQKWCSTIMDSWLICRYSLTFITLCSHLVVKKILRDYVWCSEPDGSFYTGFCTYGKTNAYFLKHRCKVSALYFGLATPCASPPPPPPRPAIFSDYSFLSTTLLNRDDRHLLSFLPPLKVTALSFVSKQRVSPT